MGSSWDVEVRVGSADRPDYQQGATMGRTDDMTIAGTAHYCATSRAGAIREAAGAIFEDAIDDPCGPPVPWDDASFDALVKRSILKAVREYGPPCATSRKADDRENDDGWVIAYRIAFAAAERADG